MERMARGCRRSQITEMWERARRARRAVKYEAADVPFEGIKFIVRNHIRGDSTARSTRIQDGRRTQSGRSCSQDRAFYFWIGWKFWRPN